MFKNLLFGKQNDNTTTDNNTPSIFIPTSKRTLYEEQDLQEVSALLQTSEVQLMPNINKLLTVYQSKIKRVVDEQSSSAYHDLGKKIFTISERLADVSPYRIAMALSAANGDVERAFDNLKNGLIGDEEEKENEKKKVDNRLRYFDYVIDLDLIKWNDQQKSRKAVKKLFNFGSSSIEEVEQQYLKQISFTNMLVEEKKLLSDDHVEPDTPGTPDTSNKLMFEKRLIEKKLREEKLARNTKFYCDGELEAIQKGQFKRYKLLPINTFDCDAEQIHYRFVESTFHRLMMNGGGGQYTYKVSEVDYIVNPNLMKSFNQCKIDLAKRHGFLIESMKPLLLFHGTSEENMDKIVNTGFLLDKIGSATDMGWYGKGFYFSEWPSMSISYSRGNPYLLLCMVLVGKAFKMDQIITGCAKTEGYDSHVSPDGCSEVIIFDPAQILPCYRMKWVL
jgi:hypothetical protein